MQEERCPLQESMQLFASSSTNRKEYRESYQHSRAFAPEAALESAQGAANVNALEGRSHRLAAGGSL